MMDSTKKIKKIKEIYKESLDINDIPIEYRDLPIPKWHCMVINKTYDEVDLFDVTRMIIPKMYLDLAISKAKMYIKENPFCGWRYEGELIELLSQLDTSDLEKDKEFYKAVVADALLKNKTYPWILEEEREEFEEVLCRFLRKLEEEGNE